MLFLDGGIKMTWLIFLRSTVGKDNSWVVRSGILLLSSLPLLQIQASSDAVYAGREKKPVAYVVRLEQEDQKAQQLEPGKPIERELVGGESHSYQLALDAGQYVKLVVDQRGIDVAVRLSGPDGK